jgi:SRSO17 transposase/ActR/RegA family two-component response regulator
MSIVENNLLRRPILIIEDNDEDYQTILWSIKKLPSHPPVFRCEDGEDALDFLNQRGKYARQKVALRPSLVFLDLNLPGQDGRAVLEQIKKDPSLKTMPIIVFTCSSNPADVEQSYHNGANSYINKPLDLESFKRTIQLTLEYWLGTVRNLPEKSDIMGVAEVFEQLTSLQDFFNRVSPHFFRPETRTQALAYLVSLLSEAGRKNCWQLAAQAGDSNPARMQRLLSHARWNVDKVLDDLRDYITEQLGHSEALVILEEISFQKKGDRSVGVLKQYCSDVGQVKNCQVGIFLTYASPNGSTLLDRELYLPPEWADDATRCFEAEVPEGVGYTSKAGLASRLLQRAATARVPMKWATGNRVFGEDTALRNWLEEQGLPYVLEITAQTVLSLQHRDQLKEISARELASKPTQGIRSLTRKGTEVGEASPEDWRRIELGESQIIPGYHHWLLFRPNSQPSEEWSYWLVFGSEVTPLPEIVRVSEQYAALKANCKASRDEVGLGHYEVRSWQGWYRHVTLAMVAQACYVLDGPVVSGLR